MTLIDAPERHEDLFEELIAEVSTYNTDVDRELLARAFDFASRAHEGQERRSGEAFIHHPFGAAKICAELRLDDETIAVGAPPRRRRGHRRRRRCRPSGVRRRDREPRRGRHEADADPVPEPRARGGRELPQDDRRDGPRRPGHPDQARRPPAQHAHPRVPGAPEAGPEVAGDPRGLRAARAPARHPQDQVGARGPRVPGAPSPQVRGDRGDGRRAPRRPRGARERGCDRAHEGARQGHDPLGDLGAREALVLDLRQDVQEGPRVQRDLRPHGDAGDRRARRRRGDARLLRRARAHPLALEADARPLQGLRRDAEVQRLPRPAHDGDRARGLAARDPDPDPRDAPRGRARDRRALAVQARQREEEAVGRRRLARLGQAAHGVGRGRDRPARVHQELPDRPLRRRGLRLHAEGRGEDASGGLDADRLRVLGAHRRRAPHGRREGQRPDRPAPLHAAQRRLRRDPDLEGRPRPVARLDDPGPLDPRPQQDPPVVLARDA